MINYIEKGIGLHEQIANSGYTLEQVNGVWTSNNDVAVQAIIDGYVEVSQVPESVSPRQIKQALTYFNKRQMIEGYISTADQDTKDYWFDSTEFKRNNPTLNNVATNLLGMTSSEIDQLFVYANSLVD